MSIDPKGLWQAYWDTYLPICVAFEGETLNLGSDVRSSVAGMDCDVVIEGYITLFQRAFLGEELAS
jgi:hypothetical protein